MSSNLADLPLDQLADQYPPALTSHGQDEFKFGRSTPRSSWLINATRYWHLVAKISSNLADLYLYLLTDLHPSTDILWSRWFQIWQIYPLVLTSHGQDEFKFGRSIPRPAGRTTPLVWTSCGQDEFKFGRSTPRSAGRSIPTPLVLTSHGRDEFKFGRSTPRTAGWSMPPALTSHGQDEFKFGRSTPRKAGWSMPPALTSCGQDQFKFGRSIPISADRSTPQYWHLVVKMISNLADLPPWYWHLMVKMSSNLADLSLDLLAELHP